MLASIPINISMTILSCTLSKNNDNPKHYNCCCMFEVNMACTVNVSISDIFSACEQYVFKKNNS